MNSLGIYEKALPKKTDWIEKLDLADQLGFNFVEMSIDESDQRLSRLDWDLQERLKVREAIENSPVDIPTLMLSGNRRFPLGSADQKTRQHGVWMVKRAVDLAVDLGIRLIQLAGYDVYYEQKTLTSRELFLRNLKEVVDYAASNKIVLAIETMDDPFIDSIKKIRHIKTMIRSPYLEAYPDLGNINAWPENNLPEDLEKGIDIVSAVHLKDTLNVTNDFPGKFKNVSFGQGDVDFYGALLTLQRLGYSGSYTIEMWSEDSDNPLDEVKKAKDFFNDLFEKVGIKQEELKHA
ncbi:MAG: L-ribulose-5-phosphate 3-epimerase [Oenococcus oeni]